MFWRQLYVSFRAEVQTRMERHSPNQRSKLKKLLDLSSRQVLGSFIQQMDVVTIRVNNGMVVMTEEFARNRDSNDTESHFEEICHQLRSYFLYDNTISWWMKLLAIVLTKGDENRADSHRDSHLMMSGFLHCAFRRYPTQTASFIRMSVRNQVLLVVALWLLLSKWSRQLITTFSRLQMCVSYSTVAGVANRCIAYNTSRMEDMSATTLPMNSLEGAGGFICTDNFELNTRDRIIKTTGKKTFIP